MEEVTERTWAAQERVRAEEALREGEERLKVLVAELQHRTRNLMGVVRSVTDKTLYTSTSLEDFQGRMRDRLNALARVNGLLSRLHEGDRISFDELLRTELMGHGVIGPNEQDSQVRLKGPEGIRLRSSTVQTLALGIHELATNALKYGALSRPEGRLEVSWGLADGKDGERRLRVDWRESGVPIPAAARVNGPNGEAHPVGRSGYGRELIERALPYQLKAETSYELTPEGVRCTITLPISTTLGGTTSTPEQLDI
jgi:two-component sensor histidine kinase